MSETKAIRSVTITNFAGLHLRAATSVADLVRRFGSKVDLIKDCERADGSEVLQMAALGAAQGEQLSLEAVGDDAEEVLDALVRLFAGNFTEDDGNPEDIEDSEEAENQR